MVMGNKYELPNGGSVWLSNEHVDLENGDKANGIIFINSEGEETRLALSDDALWALHLLHDARESPPKSGSWKAVEQTE